ncbi:MAG TPA: 3'-5' exonuclease [Phycisphaerales bacterium]|nr:3'-5' exonuclease [Phycisphaerales bacterium]
MKLPIGFDFETTDTNPATCGICQISAIELDSEEVLYNKLCIPSAPIAPQATKVHGWTRSKLIQYGAEDEEEVMAGLIPLLENRILIGYNNFVFDDRVLARYWPEFALNEVRPTIDLMRIVYRTELLDSYTLSDVYRHFVGEVDPALAHEAVFDCVMVARIAKKVIGTTPEDYMKAMEALRQPVELQVMPFGKHHGKPIDRISRRYMRYMLTLDINPDVAYTFRQELNRRPPVGSRQ